MPVSGEVMHKANDEQGGVDSTMFGFAFSDDTMEVLLSLAARDPEPGQGVRLTVTANVDHIVLLRRDAGLRKAYANAWRRTIDGFPVYVYSSLRGLDVPERITGADFFPQLMHRLVPSRHRLFLVVANEKIRAGVAAWAVRNGFEDAVAFDIPPVGFEIDEGYSDDLAARIAAHGTTHLIFGVGCPRSEIWIDRNRAKLGDCYAFAVGAAVAFFVGVTRRAPVLMRRTGFEWIWRVRQEPRRLAFRYFFRSWSFILAVLEDTRSFR